MTSRDPGAPSGKPSFNAQIDELMASAWYPPADADEASILRAEQEARRFMAEFERLMGLAETEDADEELLNPIGAHRERLIDFIRNAPVTSARSAAAVLHFLVDKQVGLGANTPMEEDFSAFARVTAWVEAEADRQKRVEEHTLFLERVEEQAQAGMRGELKREPGDPEVVAEVDAALAAGWQEPEEHQPVTDETLIAAEREIGRLGQERKRLHDALKLQGKYTGRNEGELNRLWNRADELTAWVLEAPVTGWRGAAIVVRLLLQESRTGGAEHEDALEQLLAWIEREDSSMNGEQRRAPHRHAPAPKQEPDRAITQRVKAILAETWNPAEHDPSRAAHTGAELAEIEREGHRLLESCKALDEAASVADENETWPLIQRALEIFAFIRAANVDTLDGAAAKLRHLLDPEEGIAPHDRKQQEQIASLRQVLAVLEQRLGGEGIGEDQRRSQQRSR